MLLHLKDVNRVEQLKSPELLMSCEKTEKNGDTFPRQVSQTRQVLIKARQDFIDNNLTLRKLVLVVSNKLLIT